MTQAEHVLSVNCNHGEGPVWNAVEQKLYWVDMLVSQIHTYHPASDTHAMFQFDDYVCAMAFRESGGLVLATHKHFAFWDGKDPKNLDIITEVEGDLSENRFNDGAVDPQGRFWAGTMAMNAAADAGNLYRLDADLTVYKMITNTTIANGMGWTTDQQTMYFTDSTPKIIYAYDYDPESGNISNRRDAIDTTDKPGVPDGMTMDIDNYIWTARFNGSNVTRYAPDGTVDRVVEIDAEKVTSCTFGGPDLKDLYITTSSIGMSDDDLKAKPKSGDIFRVRVDVPGQPEPLFKG